MQQSWVRIPAVTPERLMIEIKENSNICNVTSGIILQGVNCQGVMGSGVAKQLRDKYPAIFNDYAVKCKRHSHNPAEILGHTQVFLPNKDDISFLIINCFTQLFYGRDGKKYASYDALDTCLRSVKTLTSAGNHVVHIPYLIGAGLGGLSEQIVLAMIDTILATEKVVLHKFKP